MIRRRLLVLTGAGLAALLIGALAWALWTAGGSGGAIGTAATLGPVGQPTAAATGETVDITWDPATPPGTEGVTYRVERRPEPGATWSDACATTALTHITATSCSETPGLGTFVWRVTAYFQSWTAGSAVSDPLSVVDSTAPTGSVTAPAAAANVRGTVAVTSSSADSGSGVASARFERSPADADTWTTIGAEDTVAPYSVSWNSTAVVDGLYDLRVVTTDNAGNSFTSDATAGVLVDNTAPTVSIAMATGPTGAFTNGSAVYFKANAPGTFALVATVSDGGAGPASATFPLLSAAGWTTHAAETDSTPPGGPFTSTGYSWSGGASTPATTTITGTDAAGNTATKAITFSVDSTAPTGSVTAPAAAANLRGTVSVTSSSADAGSGVASASFQRSAAGTGSWTNVAAADTTSPYSGNWDTTAVSDGLYDLRVVTTDSVGNTFTSATIANVRVDNTAPTGSITAPAASATIKGTVTVTSDSADTGSGVLNALFQRSPAGTNTWTNVAAADTTSPYAASWTTTGVTDGLYDLRVITTDKSGNTLTSSLVTNVRVDNTVPTGAVTAPAASANVRGMIAVTSSSADAGSGVTSAQFQSTPHGAGTWSNIGAADTTSPYSVSWDTTAVSDGLYDLRVVATDNAGNTATSATIANVRVDNTAPTGSITGPAASANVKGTVTVTSDSADTGSGVLNALFQRSPAGTNTWTNVAAADTTSPYTASWTTTGVTDGLYDLQVITTDRSGNTLTSPLVANVRVDNTVPTVVVTLATNPVGAFLNGTATFFKANSTGSVGFVATVTDAGSGPASATFPLLSATGWTTHAAETVSTPAGGPYSSTTLTWSSGAAAPGTFTITGTDASGNTATKAITFTVDSTNPTGSVTAPAAAANVRGSVAITSGSADAGSGVASAQFQTSPAGAATWSNVGVADTVTPYSASWSTAVVADGLYDVRVIATDNVGNAFTSATIANVRVDNTLPTGAVTAPAANAFVSGSSVATSASSADGGSGVLNAQFQTSPRSAGTWSNLGAADTTSPYGVTWNTTTFLDGQYDVRVITTDKAGNAATSSTVPVEIENGAPTPTALQLTNGGVTAGQIEPADRAAVTSSQTLSVSSICSTWSGNLSDQSLSDVSLTITDGGAGNDIVSATSASCALHFGTIDLGAAGYVSGGNATFSNSTLTWSVTTRTLTITLGAASGPGTRSLVASSNAVYTPDAAIRNAVGTAVTGSVSTGAAPQF